MPRNIEIIFQDEHLIVLNKPSGLLSVPGVGPDKKDCLSTRIQAEFPTASVVHRLDRDTSGLLVMALDPATHRGLSQLFEHRKVHKIYHAVVAKQPESNAGTIDLPIHRDWTKHNPPMYKIDHEQGKPSITHWKVVRRDDDRCLLELKPETGRSHQLRLHLLTIGHPILGDNIYAPPEALAMADRLMLHASELGFTQPATSARMAFEAPVGW